MSKRKEIRDWTEILTDLEDMCSMSCKPTRKKLKADTIIDEEKSVKWNREEVQRQNDLYKEELKDLNTKKNNRRDTLEKEVFEKIADEIKGVSVEKARHIWNYAYEDSHSYGVISVISTVQELIDLFNDVLN